MYYDLQISDMINGDSVEGFYVLRAAFPKVTANGKPYLTATLSDRSGTIDAKAWDYAGPIGTADEGKVVKVRANVGEYRGAPQLTVERIRLASGEDHYDTARLVPTAPIDADAAMAAIREMVASMQDGDYKAVCEAMLARHEAELKNIPAAKSVHHGFLHGLLMHTADMLAAADFLARRYADTVDRDLLLSGTLLHDLGKAKEFEFSELGLVTDYSVRGELLGHLVMGAQEAAELCRELGIPEEKSVLLQHMVLSHHGEPEFGAAVRPMCAESELLSLIDQMDSKMEIYREAMKETPAGSFSGRIFALDRKVYHHK